MNNYSKIFWSVQVIGICLSLMAFTIGCTVSHDHKIKVIQDSFTNQTINAINIRSTTYANQYLIRFDDGSIWEVKLTGDFCSIGYKNCIFDALYKIPEKPIIPSLLPLEK